MYLRREGQTTLYGNAHPSNLECFEGKDCACKYHVVKDEKMYSFNDFALSEAKFRELSEAGSLLDLIVKHV